VTQHYPTGLRFFARTAPAEEKERRRASKTSADLQHMSPADLRKWRQDSEREMTSRP